MNQPQGSDLLRYLLRSLPVAAFATDGKGKVTFWNAHMEQLTGRSKEQMLRQKAWTGFSSTRIKTPVDLVLRTDEEEIAEGFEVTHAGTGEVSVVTFEAKPLLDDEDELIGVAATLRAPEGHADDRAREQLMGLPTPVMEIDSDFNVTFFNAAGAGLVGLTPEQAIGRKCYDLFRTPHCRTSSCQCHKAMHEDGIFTAETVVDPNGLNIPIEYTGAPLRNQLGEIIGALEYVVDITERKAVLTDIIGVAKAMASNDLTARATGAYEGDYLAIVENLNQAIEAQHDAMVQVAEAVDQISSASEQIAASSQSVAEGASEQASSLEETSSSLEEMASMTAMNASNTQEAKGLAEGTQEVGHVGSEAMDKMMDAMRQIRDGSDSGSGRRPPPAERSPGPWP